MPPLLSAIFFGGGCDNNLNNPTFYPVIDIYYWTPSESITFSISLTQSYQNIDKPFLQDDQLRKMQYIIDKLQAKMDLIKSNSRS